MQPFASGRDADVYPLDDRRVLRRYRLGGDVTPEAEVMTYVRTHGLPAPAVYEADGADLVMQRLTGPTLLAALLAGEVPPPASAEILADLHTRLHALPPRRSADPAARILHRDLHPDNVILTPGGPVLIDWRTATEGPPDLDVAITALILAEATVGSHLPEQLVPTARQVLADFLDRAGGDPVSQLDGAVAYRSGDPNLSAQERQRLTRAAEQVARPR